MVLPKILYGSGPGFDSLFVQIWWFKSTIVPFFLQFFLANLCEGWAPFKISHEIASVHFDDFCNHHIPGRKYYQYARGAFPLSQYFARVTSRVSFHLLHPFVRKRG